MQSEVPCEIDEGSGVPEDFKPRFKILAEADNSDDACARIIRARAPERRVLNRQAEIHHKGGHTTRGTLSDISENGCRLQAWSPGGKPGNAVRVKIDGLEPWPGTIRWITQDAVGIEFLRPLYVPVVESLSHVI